MKKFILAIVLSLASAAAFAGQGSWSNVTVIDIYTETSENPGAPASGTVYAVLSASSTGGPACANATLVAVDISQPGGAFNVFLLEQYFTNGTAIKAIKGSGACSVIPAAETLAYIEQ